MLPEVPKPQTWVKFKGLAMCQGCWAGCCTMPVVVSPEDLFHMGLIRFDQVEGPMKRIAARLKREGIIKTYRQGSNTFILKQNGYDCIFLDENRLCKIYDRRPSVCRKFPENAIRPGYCPCRPR